MLATTPPLVSNLPCQYYAAIISATSSFSVSQEGILNSDGMIVQFLLHAIYGMQLSYSLKLDVRAVNHVTDS